MIGLAERIIVWMGGNRTFAAGVRQSCRWLKADVCKLTQKRNCWVTRLLLAIQFLTPPSEPWCPTFDECFFFRQVFIVWIFCEFVAGQHGQCETIAT